MAESPRNDARSGRRFQALITVPMTSAASTTDRPPAASDGALDERRRRLRDLLAEQRRRLASLEGSASLSLTDRPSDTKSIAAVERQQVLLEQIVQQLKQLEETPAAAPTPVVDDGRFMDALARIERLTAEAAALEGRLNDERDATAKARQDAERLSAELSQLRDDADRRIAEARQTPLLEFTDRLQSLTAQLDKLTQDRERLQEESLLQRESIASLQADNSRLQAAVDESRFATPVVDDGELEAIRRENELLMRRVEQLNLAAESGDTDALQRENELLKRRLQQLNDEPQAPSADTADVQRRLELALQDVRELKAKSQELAAQAKSAAANAAVGTSQSYDWEAQKQRLLAQLESDFDDSQPQDKSDKLTVQGAIRITDQIVAEKDHEIDELRRMLDQQSASIGEVAVGASAIAQMFDQDELIQQERQSLKEAKEKLQEQLKAAEIDLSVERAKMAREKQKLEELARQIAVDREKTETKIGGSSPDSSDSGKNSRGKWLQRLGLRDNG